MDPSRSILIIRTFLEADAVQRTFGLATRDEACMRLPKNVFQKMVRLELFGHLKGAALNPEVSFEQQSPQNSVNYILSFADWPHSTFS
jgi:hypothetical protein